MVCYRVARTGKPHYCGGLQLFLFYPFFSPISWYPIVFSILSHRYNSRTDSGETKVESPPIHNPTKPHCFLTQRIQPGSQSHQRVGGNTLHLATLVSAHCAQPATGVAGAPGQTLPNPDDARPIVRTSRSQLVTTEPGRKPKVSDGTAGNAVQRP